MQLLEQIPKDTLSYATFPLVLSITCYLVEAMVSFFNPDVPAPHWQVNNLSLEPNKTTILAFLGSIRGYMMNSYHSYFDFMGMIFILHLAAIIIRSSQKSSVTFPEAQEFVPMTNSKKYIGKTLRYLIYYTVVFYLCQFIIGTLNSFSSILVEAKNIPEAFNDLIPQEDDFILDHLPTISKTRGAISGVISRDGKTIFQIQKIETKNNFEPYEYFLTGMDTSDPSAIKDYPESDFKLPRDDMTLVLSSDSKTLFLVRWSHLYILSISNVRSPPKLVSMTKIPDPDRTFLKPSVALYEEKNVIIIGNHYLNIFNISDLKNPIRQSWHQLSEDFESATSVAILPYHETAFVFVGAKDGLRAFDISDLNKPILKARILEDELVISISITDPYLEPTAFIGVLNRNVTDAQVQEGIEDWNASLSIYIVDLENIKSSSSLPYRSFILTLCGQNK